MVFEHGFIDKFNWPQNTTGEIRGSGKAEFKRNTEPRTKGSEEDTLRALEAGATGYVTKPFDPEDLHSLINRVEV